MKRYVQCTCDMIFGGVLWCTFFVSLITYFFICGELVVWLWTFDIHLPPKKTRFRQLFYVHCMHKIQGYRLVYIDLHLLSKLVAFSCCKVMLPNCGESGASRRKLKGWLWGGFSQWNVVCRAKQIPGQCAPDIFQQSDINFVSIPDNSFLGPCRASPVNAASVRRRHGTVHVHNVFT